MKTIFSAAVLAVGLSVSATANAWGDREQGALAGAAGLWAIQQLNKIEEEKQQQQNEQKVIVTPVPAPTIIYATPAPQRQYCETAIVIDQFNYQRTIKYCYMH